MSNEKTLKDSDIKTLRRKAKETIPGTLKSIKVLMNEAERCGEKEVSVPMAAMKQLFGFISLTMGMNIATPFDFDPNDPIGIDADPRDGVPGSDTDPNDAPNWDLDWNDT